MTNAQIQKLKAIQSDDKWASIVMKMAELHLMAQGPVDTLVDAINEVVADLEEKLEGAHAEYDRRTNEHNQEVRRLTDLIREASSDIANSQELIANILTP